MHKYLELLSQLIILLSTHKFYNCESLSLYCCNIGSCLHLLYLCSAIFRIGFKCILFPGIKSHLRKSRIVAVLTILKLIPRKLLPQKCMIFKTILLNVKQLFSILRRKIVLLSLVFCFISRTWNYHLNLTVLSVKIVSCFVTVHTNTHQVKAHFNIMIYDVCFRCNMSIITRLIKYCLPL